MTLPIWLLIALVVPVVCAYMNFRTGIYYYNLGVSVVCLLLLMFSGNPIPYLPLMLCLACALVGDYFLGHQQHSHQFYLYGIIGFLLAHLSLIWFSWDKIQLDLWVLIAGGVLSVLYGVYLQQRIFPNVEEISMKLAVAAYATVSILVVIMAMGLSWPLLPKLLYLAGVLSILYSDTIIAESDFAENQKLSRSIVPTYFASHILITAAALVMLLP